MASSIDPTKPITGNPTTLSVRDNFSAAKTEIEALQTDKADLASPALTGTATAVNLTVSGTLTASGTADLSGATLSLPNDSTISAASDPTFVVKDSDAATEDAATGYFEVQAGAGEVAVRYGNDGSRAVIDVDPDNGLTGAGEFAIEISGNMQLLVDADGLACGDLVSATEPPADFDNSSLVVHCPFDDGITLYNTNVGFGDTVGINFVGGDAAADTDYGSIVYDLGSATFTLDCDGTTGGVFSASGLQVGDNTAGPTVLGINASGASTCTLQFNDTVTNKAAITYSHSPDILYFQYGGLTFMEVQGTYVDFGGFDIRFDDNSIAAFGTAQDMEIFHNGSHNYIDLNVGNLYVRDTTTTRFTFARTTGDFTATGNVTAYSDLALKKDLAVIEDALDKLSQLTGYTYTRKDTGERQTGLIAQDVQRVLPEAVSQAADGTLALAYGNLLGLVVNAVNALVDRVEALEAKETK